MRALIFAIAATLIAVTPSAADATLPACAPQPEMAAYLAERYGEQPVEGGLVSGGVGLIELYRNDAAGTWTLIATRATDRLSCVIATGTDWAEQGEGS